MVGVEDRGQIPDLKKWVLWRQNHCDQDGRDNQVRMRIGPERKPPIKNKRTASRPTHPVGVFDLKE